MMSEMKVKELLDFCNKYTSKTVKELIKEFDITSRSKQINYIVSKSIIHAYKGKEYGEYLLESLNLMLKTVQLNCIGTPKESMSFPVIDYKEIVNEEWETSSLRKMFKKDFLFFVFKPQDDTNVLDKVILWKMPDTILDSEVKDVWNKTVEMLRTGNVVKEVNNNKTYYNFPAEADNDVCHVRPHGSKAIDSAELPVPDAKTGYVNCTKHSFWLNKLYIKSIING